RERTCARRCRRRRRGGCRSRAWLRIARSCGSSPRARRRARAREPSRLGYACTRRDAVRVALADDAALLREGLARVLAAAGVEIAAQVGDADELLRAVEELHPDVAVVDIRMPPTWSDEGLGVAEEIRRRFPDVGVLLLSQYVEAGYALRLLDGGSE